MKNIYFTNIITNKSVTIHDCSNIKTVNEYITIVQNKRLSAIQLDMITDEVIELVHFQTHVVFGSKFNRKLILNRDLEFLIFGMKYNTHIVLTKKLMFVTFGYYFEQHLLLPKNIIQIFLEDNSKQCILLPKYTMYLNIACLRISHSLPKKIKCLTASTDIYERVNVHSLSISKNIVKLALRCSHNLPMQLPKHLKHLRILGRMNINNLVLTPNIVSLTLFHPKYDSTIDNLAVLTNIDFGIEKHTNYYLYDNLPNGVRIVKHDCFNKKLLNNLPNTVTSLINTRCYSRTVHENLLLSENARINLYYHRMIYQTD